MAINNQEDRANKFASDKLQRLIVSAPSEEDRDNVIQFYDLMHKMLCVGFFEADKDREKLVEALSWYADRNNCDNADFAHVEISEDGEEIADGGFRARTTLKELGEME